MPSILVVEDSIFSRKTIVHTLIEAGYEASEIDKGREAIELAVTLQPDCITLDLLMPGVCEKDVLSILAAKGLDIPIVVITSDIQDSTRGLCMKLGAKAFLNKPPGREELIATIATVIGNKEKDKNAI